MAANEIGADLDLDDIDDETWDERLWGARVCGRARYLPITTGLTEMFPQPIRNACGGVADKTMWLGANVLYYGRNALWIGACAHSREDSWHTPCRLDDIHVHAAAVHCR